MHSVVIDFGTEQHLEELVDSALMMMDETEGIQLDWTGQQQPEG